MRLLSFAVLLAALSACSQQYYNNPDVVDETYVHKYGVEVPQDFWTSSGEHGTVITTMGDGVVISRTYANGILDGETTYSFPHSSQIQKREIYNLGNLEKVVEIHIDGTPKSETIYNAPSNGMKTVSTWYLSGTPRSVETYNGGRLYSGQYYTSSNQRDATVENYEGKRLVRDDYGQLLSTDTIKNGEMTLSTTYHPNGSPKEMIPYKNGMADGNKRTFHPAGEPNSIEQWSAGAQHGDTVVYLHGERYAEIPYANGSKQGVERRYRNGTQLVQEISWDNDQQHGPATTYVGDSSKTDWYYKGNQTTQDNYEFMVNRPVVR